VLSKRDFLLGLGAAAALGPRVHARQLGQATLSTVSDGSLVLPGSFVFEPMPQAELPDVLSAYDVSPDRLTSECNLALYQDGQNTVLFDVGSGPDFMPSAGHFLDSLDAVGVAPEDVTHVVFTHAHPDHIWGLIDGFDEPVFYEATYLMGRVEWDYWWNPETVNTIGEARAAFAVGAKRRMEYIEDTVAFFDDGDEILPGIAAISTPGHTPGHMAFELHSGSESALIVGDAIGNHHVAFARPDWPSGSDHDAEAAAKARSLLLDRLAHEHMPVVGFHLPNGGMGRVEMADTGYRFISEGP